MLVNVKLLNGSSFPIEISEERTIKDLKQMLVNKCGWQTDDQKLIYRGRVLRDEDTCRTANLEDGIAIHLVQKARTVDPPQDAGHPMDEGPDHGPGFHGILIESSPNLFGIHATSTNVDPVQRLQTLTHVAQRLDQDRISRFEAANAHIGNLNAAEIFATNSAMDMDDSFDENDPNSGLTNPSSQPEEISDDEESVGGDDEDEGRAALRLYRNVVMQALGLTERVLPFADILSQAVASNRRLTPNGKRVFQSGFDTMNTTLHELSHLFHGLSDIMVDFQKPVRERTLTVSPRVHIEHRAMLSTAITIPTTAVGVPNIANLIAQQLEQLPELSVPFVSMPAPQPQHNNQNSANSATSASTGPVLTGIRTGVSPQPTNNSLGSQPQHPGDPVQAMSQAVANRVSSLIGQHASGNAEPSDLTRILPCSSNLTRSYNTQTPALSPHSVGHFESRFVSPMQFASDMLAFSAHPLAIQFLQYIHSDIERPELSRETELLLAESIVRPLIYLNGDSVVYLSQYAPDGVNFGSPTPDFKMRMQEIVIECLRTIRTKLMAHPYPFRQFGLVEAFHTIAPVLMQDLKCFFRNNRFEAQLYVRDLLEHVLPVAANGTKLLLEDELLKCFDKADSTLSKYHGKIQDVIPAQGFRLDPDDIDEEYSRRQ